jgi:hypothetical protein
MEKTIFVFLASLFPWVSQLLDSHCANARGTV